MSSANPFEELNSISNNINIDEESIEVINDIPVTVRVRLGTKKMIVEDFLKLKPGSYVELDTRVGEPVEIYINETLIGYGDILIVDGYYAVKVSKICSKKDMINNIL